MTAGGASGGAGTDVRTLTFGDWPGRIHSGPKATARLGAVLAELGARRAMVVCGRTVAAGALVARVTDGLGAACAGVFDGVRPHTPVEMVAEGVRRFRDLGADSLVSVGGGSAIDAAKAIAIMLLEAGDLRDYVIRYAPGGEMSVRPLPKRPVPHVAVPTTAGSASDVMPTAGVRDPENGRKLLFWDARLVPGATVLDPEMAVEAGPELTAATGMTAMARAVESFYSGKRHPISTGLALHAARLLAKALPRSVAAPDDLEARAACQMAATMSGMAAINAMVSLVHAIGHGVGGRYGLQHGVSHAILLPRAARLLLPTVGPEQGLLADALGCGNAQTDPDDAGRAAADALQALLEDLPLPQRLGAVGVEAEHIDALAEQTMGDYMMGNLPSAVTQADVAALLRDAL